MIYLTDDNSENVVFLTDSRSVLDSLAGHGEHNLRRKLYSVLEHRKSGPTMDSSTLCYKTQ